MQSSLSPKANDKPTDDPCDDVVIVPDAAQVAPSDEELSNLLQAARHRFAAQARTVPDVTAGATSPPIDVTSGPVFTRAMRDAKNRSDHPTAPQVDAASRPVPANDVLGSRGQRSLARGATRAFFVLLLAGCIGLTAAAWKSYGATATKLVTKLAAQLVVASQSESSTPAAQPAPAAVQVEAAKAASEQPAAQAQAAPAPAPVPNATAPAAPASSPATPDSTQLLQSMARDLATLGQEVEELKASMEQLKASQQQMSRDVAKVSEQKASEQNAAQKASAPPSRPTAAQTRKPVPSPSPPQATATSSTLPRVAGPYYAPPRPEPPYAPPPPQAAPEPYLDPALSAPRPPMPVR